MKPHPHASFIGLLTIGIIFELGALTWAGPNNGRVDFTASNLPIVVIDTFGQDIPNEPKVPGWMSIIDNGGQQINYVTDIPNIYDGHIGIELRGSSSLQFPKKSYGFETRGENGDNLNVSLLGMPPENDWVLYGPYSDKTLLRNVLAFHLARQTGRYASRTRLCEVMLNNDYIGVYVLMEKIKKDGHRVDISTLNPEEIDGDDLTGGYIIKIDKWDGSDNDGWESSFPAADNPHLHYYYQYDYPKATEIVPEQAVYIQQYFHNFEAMMQSDLYQDPIVGFPAYIDIGSFVDFIIINEVTKNVDGYRLSTFFHKDKDSIDGKLKAGPVWDYNLGFGNCDYYSAHLPYGFQIDCYIPSDDAFQNPFWWPKLFHESTFSNQFIDRWEEFRQSFLTVDSIWVYIDGMTDELHEAQQRNFARWPILGVYVWPNYYVGNTYEDEINHLKNWIEDRLLWIDAAIDQLLPIEESVGNRTAFNLTPAFPNPFTTQTEVFLTVGHAQQVNFLLFDISGRLVENIGSRYLPSGSACPITVNAKEHPTGFYILQVQGENSAAEQRLLLLK